MFAIRPRPTHLLINPAPGQLAFHDPVSMIPIRDASDVQALRRAARRPRQPIALVSPNDSEPQLIALLRTVNRHRSDCGCAMGARFLIMALATHLALALWHRPTNLRGVVSTVLAIFGSAVLAALIGKGVGVLWAHRQYRQSLERLSFAICPAEPSTRKKPPCLVAG